MYCSCSVGLRSLTGDAYHEFVTPHSRFGAIRAAPGPARGAKQAAAIPASCNRLYRIAKDLSHIKKFDHGSVRGPQTTKKEMGRHSHKRMPPPSHQPCSFFAVSAITRP